MDSLGRALRSLDGDPSAAGRILPLVYEELRLLAVSKLAAERPGHTLQPTALVHEAWLRVTGPDGAGGHWAGRAHFFAAAAEAMRRILIDNARRRSAIRNGGDRARVDLDEALASVAAPACGPGLDDAETDSLLALDAALAKLEMEDKPKSDIVKLHYFVGLSLDETAAALGISRATAYRHWTYARAWLRHEVLAGKS